MTDSYVQQTLALLKGMQEIRLTCSNLSVNNEGVKIDNIAQWDPPHERFARLEEPDDDSWKEHV